MRIEYIDNATRDIIATVEVDKQSCCSPEINTEDDLVREEILDFMKKTFTLRETIEIDGFYVRKREEIFVSCKDFYFYHTFMRLEFACALSEKLNKNIIARTSDFSW